MRSENGDIEDPYEEYETRGGCGFGGGVEGDSWVRGSGYCLVMRQVSILMH